jgi:putative membrane-bound dehydrogenase-like protein
MRDSMLRAVRGGWVILALLFASTGATDEPPKAVREAPPRMIAKRTDVKPFEYTKAKVPFYPPSAKWGVTGEPIARMQLPLAPEESVKHTVHPEGFELKLFASDPDIKRPICMNWDHRGRLWIAESVDYPNERKLAGQGRDRLVICDDTDGDGRADKFTVFADKLSIPTGFTFARGGVIVLQAPHTLYLKDNDGDDVADERRILFTGWSTYDTHAGPSNLQYGLDNWIYGMVGYAGFRGTVGGEEHSFRTGFFRFKPDGSKIEFLRNTSNNSWGVGFSEEGILFGSTANGNPSVYLPIPNRYYERVRGWSSRVLSTIAESDKFYPITDKVRQVDFHGRFTSAAGHALYTARTYPKLFWNRAAFVCEPTGHLVATYLLEREGADFSSRYDWNLLASDDEWTAPIMAEVGPDGNVWIIDWYNYIVQHNPTPPGFKTGKGNAYETPLRDKTHGRIYRLVYKGAKVPNPTPLQNGSPEELVAALKHDNLFWRRYAQRLLVERQKLDVLPELLRLAADPSVDEIGLNAGAIHALWTMHGLGTLEGAQPKATAGAVAALRHKSAGVRRNAVAVVPRNKDSLRAVLDAKLLDDRDAQVRLATLLAVAEMPAEAEAGLAVAALLNKPENYRDGWIRDAATSAAASQDLSFLKALTGQAEAPPARVIEVLAVVAEHYARGKSHESLSALVALLPRAPAKTTETILGGFAKGWPKNRLVIVDPTAEKALAELLNTLSASGKGQVLKLARVWGSQQFTRHAQEVVQSLLVAITDEKKTDDQRIGAAKQIVELLPEDEKILKQLLELLTARTSPALVTGILDALGSSQSPALGPALLQRLPTLTPQGRSAGLRVLLSRPESTRALLDGLEKGKAHLGDLTLEQKQSLASHPDQAIARRSRKLLERGGGLPSPDRQKVLEQLLPVTKRQGDPALGKAVFKQHCAACHTHSGEGTKIGPDLTGHAVQTKEHLLTEIIDPNKSVEGNYRVYTVTTQNGQVLNGLLASETKTSVELFDSQGKKHVLLREDIDELLGSSKSLMPEGFEKQISEKELADLLEFLTQRGKFLPLSLDKVATVVSTRGMFNSPDAQAERLIFADWSPKTFEGVPFHLVDPQGDRALNAILLYGPQGTIPPKMPKSVSVPCKTAAKAVHFLSGINGWGYPLGTKGSVSMIVRLHYADGKTEDHPLKNGEHFADYIRRVDVPDSKFAFSLRGRQLRYLAVTPKRSEIIDRIELVKGPDATAPVVMAITVETR